MPSSASWRRSRYSSKSPVTNQQRTSTSSEDGENAASFETTASGQTFGIPRSSCCDLLDHPAHLLLSVVPWRSPTVVAKRMRSRQAKSSIRMSASLPFGRLISVRSGVRIWVERMPIRSTLPVKSSILTRSPTRNGWSAARAIEPKRFSIVFCAPKAMAMPPMPRPARTVATG